MPACLWAAGAVGGCGCVPSASGCENAGTVGGMRVVGILPRGLVCACTVVVGPMYVNAANVLATKIAPQPPVVL